jgi:AraC-like DNA-binding protein
MPLATTLSRRFARTLIFVSAGRLDLSCDGRCMFLGTGEALLVESSPGDGLSLHCGNDTEVYLVQLRVRSADRRAPSRQPAPPASPRRTIEIPDHVAIRNMGRMKHLMRMLLEESRRDGGSPLVLHHLAALVACEMASSSRVAADARENGLESIASRVDALIAAHYHEPIGTPDIARELRYNPDYLERAYRSERGVSIREAIHARRFREAQAQLLLQRERGIAEIAALCGYADPGYFRRVFKRATSLTPHRYRLLHAPGDRLRPAERVAAT